MLAQARPQCGVQQVRRRMVGADTLAPLGIAVIGGVVTSTLLTLLVVPTIYEVLDGLRQLVGGRLGRRPAQRTREFPVPGGAVPVAGD